MKMFISLFLAVGFVVFSSAQFANAKEEKSEPVCEGKPLKDWIKAFQDPDPNVRQKALRVLGEMGPKAAPAVPVLIRSLDEKDISIRTMVSITLSQIGKPAVPALLEVFKDRGRDQFVRGDAASALGRIGADAKETIPDLIQALKDPEIGFNASLALGAIGKVALPSLLEALKEEDEETRAGAARALGQMGPDAEEAVPTLRQALKGSDVAFRVQAAKALVQLHPKDQEALSTLIESLTGTDENVRREAMYALGDIGPEARKALPALEAILKEEAGGLTAASAILRIQPAHQAALAAVIEALKEDHQIYNIALAALERLGPQAREAVPSLIPLLKNHQEHVVDQVVRTLGKIGPSAKEAVPALIEALRDRKSIWTVRALGEIGSSEAVSTLVELLKDQDPNIRQYSASALREIGPGSKAAVPALLDALKDEDDNVRTHAIMALGEIKADAKATLPYFVEAVKDKNLSVRVFAVASLGDLGPEAKSAVPVLLESVKKDKDLSRNVAIALGQIGPEAKVGIPLLLEWLKDQKKYPRQYDLRVQAALALWRIEQNKELTLPVLREALKDPEAYVRVEAALALWRMGEEKEKMISLLLGMLKGDVPKDEKSRPRKQDWQAKYERFHVAAALGEIGPEAKAAVPILLELLGAKEDFRKAVQKALKKIDPAAAAKAGVP